MWLKRRFPADGFGAASVFETFVEHCIALGTPLKNVDGRGEIAGRTWSDYMDPASSVRMCRLPGVWGSARDCASEGSHLSDRPQWGVREVVLRCGGRDQLVPSGGDRHLPRPQGVLPTLVSGDVIIATVLSLPTAGPILIQALKTQDQYLAGALLLFQCIFVLLGTLLSDLLLARPAHPL